MLSNIVREKKIKIQKVKCHILRGRNKNKFKYFNFLQRKTSGGYKSRLQVIFKKERKNTD